MAPPFPLHYFLVPSLISTFPCSISSALTAANDPNADILALVDQALAHLEAGLPLDWPPHEQPK
jgi:hypothetical protein